MVVHHARDAGAIIMTLYATAYCEIIDSRLWIVLRYRCYRHCRECHILAVTGYVETEWRYHSTVMRQSTWRRAMLLQSRDVTWRIVT